MLYLARWEKSVLCLSLASCYFCCLRAVAPQLHSSWLLSITLIWKCCLCAIHDVYWQYRRRLYIRLYAIWHRGYDWRNARVLPWRWLADHQSQRSWPQSHDESWHFLNELNSNCRYRFVAVIIPPEQCVHIVGSLLRDFIIALLVDSNSFQK